MRNVKRILSDKSHTSRAPRVVDGHVLLLSSKLCNVYGSMATASYDFKPLRIAEYTFSGYNLERIDCLSPDWRNYEVPSAALPRLAGADPNPLKLTAVVRLADRLGNATYRLPFFMAESLVVDFFLGSTFLDTHIQSIDVANKRLESLRGCGIAIVDAKGFEAHVKPQTQYRGKKSRKKRYDNDRLMEAQPILLANWVRIALPVSTMGSGLVFIDPKPSLRSLPVVALLTGRQTLCQSERSGHRNERRLPKNTTLGCEKRHFIAIFAPERKVAEEVSRVLNILSVPDTSPETFSSTYGNTGI